MSNNSLQIPLFNARLNTLPVLKAELARAAKDSNLSRDQIVDKMNEYLEREGVASRVTVSVFDKWLAPSAKHAIPVHLLPIFCKVAGSCRPLSIIVEPLGLKLAGPREQNLMVLGEAHLDAKKASAKRRKAMEALEGMQL